MVNYCKEFIAYNAAMQGTFLMFVLELFIFIKIDLIKL